MKDFKPMKKLEDLQDVKVGDLIGMGQCITETIPTLCISYKDGRIRLIGTMDNKIVMKYDVLIKNIKGIYDDGSIQCPYTHLDKREYIEESSKESSKEYGSLRQQLISAGIWEDVK